MALLALLRAEGASPVIVRIIVFGAHLAKGISLQTRKLASIRMKVVAKDWD